MRIVLSRAAAGRLDYAELLVSTRSAAAGVAVVAAAVPAAVPAAEAAPAH